MHAKSGRSRHQPPFSGPHVVLNRDVVAFTRLQIARGPLVQHNRVDGAACTLTRRLWLPPAHGSEIDGGDGRIRNLASARTYGVGEIRQRGHDDHVGTLGGAGRNRCKRVVQYRASTVDGDNPLLCKRPDPEPEVVNRRVLTQQALGIGRRAARNEDRVRPPGLLDESLQPRQRHKYRAHR